ncbi:MAG: FAD-dependent oxidoreductase, partial [Waterburya sp.]
MSQKLVLIGGGHAHAIALKKWGLDPLPDIDLTLISDVEQTPYSGMLPGHVAGFYNYRETHIDLPSLAQFAGAKFICDRAIAIEPEHNQIICPSGRFEFDYLSLDIGSTPQSQAVPGAEAYTVPAKPVPLFLAAWEKLKQLATANPDQPLSMAIVGGGAGGVELALNMQSCLSKILKKNNPPKIHLIHRSKQLLSAHNPWVSQKLTKIIQQRGIQLHLQQHVTEVLPAQIICQSGLKIAASNIFWVTQAAAPSWIKESQLKTDDQGFILVG